MRQDNYRGRDDVILPVGPDGQIQIPALPTFDSSTLLGVDLSHYQGDVDFVKLKAAGCAFVFIKATEGTTIVDAKFAAYRAGAKSVKMPCGAYHFFRPKADLQGQIDAFCNTVGSLQPGDLPPVLDVESPADWTGFTVAQRVAMVLGWLKGVEAKLGVKPIIYINNPMCRDILGSPAAFKDYILWVAHYTSNASPSIPLPWTFYTFWQYSEHGSIGGVTGEVDLNRFAGTLADLQRLRKPGFAVDEASAPAAKPEPCPLSGFCYRLRERVKRWFRRLFGR
jgi:lysozyme